MPLTFTPSRGQILICDFDTARIPPEMRKVRRVVVVSNRSRNNAGRLIVVPFSATEPTILLPSHVFFPAGSYQSFGIPAWAICDCVAHVSFKRLDRVLSKGRHIVEMLTSEDMQRIEAGLSQALGMRR